LFDENAGGELLPRLAHTRSITAKTRPVTDIIPVGWGMAGERDLARRLHSEDPVG